MVPPSGPSATPTVFEDQTTRTQVFLAPRVAGRLKQASEASRGGFVDVHPWYHPWEEPTPIGTLECQEEDLSANPALAQTLRMLLSRGRATAEWAEGLFAGLSSSVRAWWSEGGGEFGTLLSLGICEQVGIIGGARYSFFELFEMVPGPVHVSVVPDLGLVPSAAALVSQLQRTPEQQQAIVADLARTFGPLMAAGSTRHPKVISDWHFAGQIMEALGPSPILERHEVLTSAGIQELGPPAAVVLSLNSENSCHFRHKRLGYFLSLHLHRLGAMGPLLWQWLRQEFEEVRKTPEEFKQDYRELIGLVQTHTQAHLVVINTVATNFSEDCFCYAPFDKPLSNTLSHVRAQESNLMLYELAHEHDISIVDLDALATELGSKHIPDGVHGTGFLQAILRAQIVAILRERGIAGFGAPAACGLAQLR
jgi:hypothetical protein